MNNLVRYLKTISTTCLWVAVFASTLSHAYAFDDDRLDLTITNFFDSLSYKYKGFDLGIKKVSIGEVFDDNITFAKENKQDDFITYAGIVLGAQYQGKTRTFELTGNIVNQTFAKNDNFNNIIQYINLSFTNEFSKRDRISLSSSFTHFEAPESSDSDAEGGYFLQQFGRTGGRFEYFRNKLNIAYTNDIAKELSLVVKYASEVNVFSGTDRANSFLDKPGLGMNYIFSPTATIFSFSYDFTSIRFENENNATINTIGPTIRQYITKKLYFDGGTGIDFIDSFDDENITKLFFKASLTYIPEEKTRVNISFNKKYEANPYFEGIYNNWRTTASLTRQLLERMNCSLSFFYGDGEQVSSNFEQRLLGGRSTLGYNISKNLKGDLTYTYSQSDTNSETTGYSKNTLFLGLAAEF